jgi:hypothetical protein
MICGLVSPKSIGLINREHINQLLKRSKLMFQFSKLAIIGTSFAAFYLSGVLLIINSSFPLHFIGFFWSLLFASFAYFTFGINLSQMTYFYIICLYLKLKLRNANNCIRKSFDNKLK